MWSEVVSAETIDSRLWPRAAAIAERLWSPAEVRDVDDMYRRLEIESVRLDAGGVTHRSSYEPMLKRIAGDGPVEPLKRLADVLEPVKGYARTKLHAYTSATPLDRLVDAGHTVLVIEHNIDVIKRADWVIDLGPGAGDQGGRIVAAGTPEDVARVAESVTGRYLRDLG